MTKPNQLARVCSNCGVKKPLSAFLQLGGPHGASYSTICAECRRTGTTPDTAPIQEKDESSSSSGFQIKAQQKIAADIERKKQRKDLKEAFQLEEKKLDELKLTKETRHENKVKAEKDHRQFYIDAKKQTFLTTGTKKTGTAAKQTIPRSISNESGFTAPAAEAATPEQTATQERQLTTIDLTLPFLAPQSAEIRHNSAAFLQFKQWLGAGAPISKQAILKSLEKLYNKDIAPPQTKSIEKKAKDPFVEKVENSVKPTSGRGR